MGSERIAGRGGITPDPATVFNIKLSSLVVSAIRTTLAPAIPAPPGPGDASEVVMVPVLVFRGDVGGNALEAEDPAQSERPFSVDDVLDVAQVSMAVNSMALPGQEILVVGTVHSFSQHPQVNCRKCCHRCSPYRERPCLETAGVMRS